MSKTSILQFGASSEATQQDAIKALREAKLSGNITFGPHIQDQSIIQVTSEDETKPIVDTLQPILGTPTTTFTVPFSILSNAGPATFPVVEYVQNFFPLSKLTPAFQSQIEADFLKFFTTSTSKTLIYNLITLTILTSRLTALTSRLTALTSKHRNVALGAAFAAAAAFPFTQSNETYPNLAANILIFANTGLTTLTVAPWGRDRESRMEALTP